MMETRYEKNVCRHSISASIAPHLVLINKICWIRQETDLDGSIFSSMTSVFDLAVSQTSSHSVFGDGSGLHIVGDVDSGADSSCNEGNQACTTEDAIIDLANGPTVNDEKDMVSETSFPSVMSASFAPNHLI